VPETFLENDPFRTNAELLWFSPLGIANESYEPERELLMHPLFGFARWALHAVEPAALARHNASVTGRDLLWQVAAFDESAGTPSGEALIAAAGVPVIGATAYVMPSATVAGPIAGSGAVRFDTGDHLMLGYRNGSSKLVPPGLPPFESRPTPLAFDNPIDAVYAQLTHFFETRRATGTAEIR
jgi:hypothetical protein